MKDKRRYLRLVVDNRFDGDERLHLDSCREWRSNAASPRGEALRPLAMSPTEEAANPTSPAISDKVIPVDCRSRIRDAHVVISPILRNPVGKSQRLSVTEFRSNVFMVEKEKIPVFPSVGQRVRWWRQKRGMSRAQLGKAMGRAATTVGDLENQYSVNTTRIASAARALGLNPHYLETGEGEPDAKVVTVDSGAWPFRIDPSHFENMTEIEMEVVETHLELAREKIMNRRKPKRKAG